MSNNGSNQLIPIDTTSNTLRPGFTTSGHVINSAVAPDGSILYAPNFTFGSVTRNDLATQTQLAPIQGFGAGYNLPFGIAISPDNHWVYWSDGQAIGIHDVTDPNGAKVITSIGSCCQNHGIALTPDGKTLYVGNSGDNTVTPFDTATKTLGSPISVGQHPWAIAITPDQAPVARLQVTRAPIGSPTTFDASASTVKYGTIASYAWDFGDGTTDVTTTPTTQHTYTGGSYTASVTETSSGGTSTTTSAFTGQTFLRHGGSGARATALGSLAGLGAPVVSEVSPGSGVVGGGTSVNIIGSGFTGSTAVTFGGTAATGVTVNGDNSITATTPAAAGPGTVDVRVTNSIGVSAVTPADQFRYLGSVPAVTNSCTNMYCAVAFGTAGISVSASTSNSCNVCNMTGGIEPLAVPSKCGYGQPDLVPAGWVQTTQNSGPLSFIALSVQYQNILADIYSSSDKAAQQLVSVCYQDGTPHVVSGARTAAAAAPSATTAATTTPKPFVLKDCVKTKDVPPCVAAKTLVDGVVNVTMHVPASGSTFQIFSKPVLIKKLTPVFGLPSSAIKVSGKNMAAVTGAVIGGIQADITSRDAKSVTVTIPDGARSGPITLLTNGGAVTSPKPLSVGPTITKIPSTAKVGAKVSINGYLLGGATSVAFNGTPGTIVSVKDNVVVATVPAGTTAGPITVTTPNGTATSPTTFTPKS